jgi:hypothetical protein
VCALISDMEIQYSQLKINHLTDTPSTKAAGGGIYSIVLLKDVKVPVKVRRTLSSVGTSSSNKQGVFKMTKVLSVNVRAKVWEIKKFAERFVISHQHKKLRL